MLIWPDEAMLSWCRKPDAVVNMPAQAQSPFKDLLTQYFVALQQARFHDSYIWLKMTAVGHMLASPAVLFGPGVVVRLLWFLLTDRLKVVPTRQNSEGTKAAGNAAATAAAVSNKF